MFKDIKFRFIKRKKNIKEFLLSIPKDRWLALFTRPLI